MILIYDASFEGFLTSVFTAYEYRCQHPKICTAAHFVADFFEATETVITDATKAERVWKAALQKIGKSGGNHIYRAFLSEKQGIETCLFQYVQHAFASSANITNDYAHPAVLQVAQVVKQVNREKHRMEAFVRFRQTRDGVYFATVEPDFNVLPLIAHHFKNRYADQQWCIYDVRRKYGLWYDLERLSVVDITLPADVLSTRTDLFTEQEIHFQDLWKTYFNQTNIKSRKNTKLHQQHVPKRYWKYLTEK